MTGATARDRTSDPLLTRQSLFRLSYSSAAAILLLSGCASNPLPETVGVPVPVPCIQAGQLPPAPDVLSDADLFALDDYRAVLELARARIVLRDHAAELTALLQGCL